MKNRHILLLGVIVLLSVFALWGCPKKAEVTTTPERRLPQKQNRPTEKKCHREEGSRLAALQAQEESRERAATAAAGLQPIYFDFDKSFVRDDARAMMKANAEWLKANPKVEGQDRGELR